MAALAEKAGARIFEDSPAVSLDPAGVRKRVATPQGTVRAGHIVLAGSFTRVVFAKKGDTLHGDFGQLGGISVQFV